MKAPKDFWTGSIFLVVGLVGLFIAKNYNFGTATRMGPGFFPVLLTGLLALVGLASVVKSFVVEGDAVGKIAMRPVAAIIGSVAIFGLAVEPLGGPLAMLLTVMTAAMGSREFKLASRPVLGALTLVCVCSVVFIELLNVPIPLIGTWLQPLLPNF
ncbi:tripartite tricarboxylate transporter TctB family protein (plasmid) [Agrobacterium vitis]|uniref:tripartite tricarboxylate transporter TctB family protein n=1 Tax=Agrobacterium vitis TaxID=373 RepID=UPI0012E97226|nr:tripartite tricarboxylate transporter TctB family protein [Agrobacterium vitis]MVA27305.1 tripartite tricarboxylate transporter TctB family protein [Agrobacterium vitis]